MRSKMKAFFIGSVCVAVVSLMGGLTIGNLGAYFLLFFAAFGAVLAVVSGGIIPLCSGFLDDTDRYPVHYLLFPALIVWGGGGLFLLFINR